MALFSSLFLKLFPLYFFMVLGFVSGRFLGIQKESIAKLLIYMITPGILFYGGYTTRLSLDRLTLPLLFFLFSCVISLLFLKLGQRVFKGESTQYILAFTAGTGNTGYFGLPVALALFGDSVLSIAVLMAMGVTLYENSLGFYLAAKGHHTAKESLIRVLRLPGLYLFGIGLILNVLGLSLGTVGEIAMTQFKGAYTLLGMMLIGMGLSAIRHRIIDYKFIGMALLARSVAWPILIAFFLLGNHLFFHFYPPTLYPLFGLMAVVPMAANTVAVAVELNVHPDKAALAVVVSTLLAMFYIPILASLGLTYFF